MIDQFDSDMFGIIGMTLLGIVEIRSICRMKATADKHMLQLEQMHELKLKTKKIELLNLMLEAQNRLGYSKHDGINI